MDDKPRKTIRITGFERRDGESAEALARSAFPFDGEMVYTQVDADPTEVGQSQFANFGQFIALKHHELEKWKVEGILEEWQSQQQKDRDLRKLFGLWMLSLLSLQMLSVTGVFIAVAFGRASIISQSLPFWLGALVIEVIGIVAIAAKGLFTNTTKEHMSMVRSILNHEEPAAPPG